MDDWTSQPTSDLTVFQAHYGKTTLKIYNKGERPHRVAVVVHDPRRTAGVGPCRALQTSSFASVTSGRDSGTR